MGKLVFLSGCWPDDCERVYDAGEQVIVLAKRVTDSEVIAEASPSSDEILGSIPREVFLAAARKLLDDGGEGSGHAQP